MSLIYNIQPRNAQQWWVAYSQKELPLETIGSPAKQSPKIAELDMAVGRPESGEAA